MLARYLRERGLETRSITTRYEGERDDARSGESADIEDNPALDPDAPAPRRPVPFSGRPGPGPRRRGRRMIAFAALYTALDETTKTTEKVEALTRYFAAVPPEDAAWAVYFLIGRKPKQVVPSGKLRLWAAAEAGIPDWLFQEAYDAVGDVAETIALVLPEPESGRAIDRPLHEWVEDRLLKLRNAGEDAQRLSVLDAWSGLGRTQRFVWNKLISGGFRVGVSQQLVTRALGKVSGIEPSLVAHRLMGDWEPTPAFYAMLHAGEAGDADLSKALPLLPGLRPGGRARDPRPGGRLAGRMEVGRHPFGTRPQGRPDVPLVTRRGAGDRALPGDRRRGRRPARRHSRRRRTPPLPRRPPPPPSPSSSAGSAARPWARRSWPRCRSS